MKIENALVTFYTVFVIDLASRRVQIVARRVDAAAQQDRQPDEERTQAGDHAIREAEIG